MATNITAEWTSKGPDGRGSVETKVISLADVVVNSRPNATGGWTTATVTADKSLSHALAQSDGVPAGRYEKCAEPDRFRLARPA